MVGRLLRHVYSVSESAFSEALCEAEGWASARFRGDEALLAQAQGVVRLVVGIGREKLEYLRTVPYLFVRLHEPGVVAEVIRQWESTPREQHHTVTLEFMDIGSPLRPLVYAFFVDSGRMPRMLEEACENNSDIPFDDVIAEGPHASAKRVIAKTRRATWVWVAAFLRVEQNLRSVRTLGSGVELQPLWERWPAAINTRHQRSVRGKRRNVLSRIYALRGAAFVVEDIADEHAALGDGDDEGVEAAALHGRAFVLSDDAVMLGLLVSSSDRNLLHAYASGVAKPFMYITVPTRGIDGDPLVKCYQISRQKG
jgi:hypothetical protein